MNVLNVAGIMYDILGATLLAKAIAFTSDKLLAAQAGSYTGWNPVLLAALDEQRLDAKYGLGILIAGFLLQLLAAIGIGPDVPPLWLFGFALVLVAIVGLYRVQAHSNYVNREERFQEALQGKRKPADQG